MNIEEYRKNIRHAIADLESSRANLMLAQATIAISLIKKRVQKDGEKADGSSYGKYSQAKVPYWFFENKESTRNAKAQAKQMRDNVGFFASYDDWRKQHGLQIDHKDFTFTGRMMQSIKPTLIQHSATKTTINVGSNIPHEQKKLQYNSQREGELLRLSLKEETVIKAGNTARVIKILKNNNL